MRKRFNLQAWLKDKSQKVETRCGFPVRIICCNRAVKEGQPTELKLCVLVQEDGGETVYLYYSDGTKWAKDENYDLFLVTPEPELTEFEKELESFYNHHLQVCTYDNQRTVEDSLHDGASKLLALAKKELCNRCSTGLNEYWRGRKEAMEEASKGYHYEGPTIPAYWPPCHYGGECTNPFHDCISCPRKSTIDINTTTGTSTAKVEG